MINGNKREWEHPTLLEIQDAVKEIGGRAATGRLLGMSERSIRSGASKVKAWMFGESKIPPACWAIMKMKLDSIEVEKYL